jgi:hypothetical protein
MLALHSSLGGEGCHNSLGYMICFGEIRMAPLDSFRQRVRISAQRYSAGSSSGEDSSRKLLLVMDNKRT